MYFFLFYPFIFDTCVYISFIDDLLFLIYGVYIRNNRSSHGGSRKGGAECGVGGGGLGLVIFMSM